MRANCGVFRVRRRLGLCRMVVRFRAEGALECGSLLWPLHAFKIRSLPKQGGSRTEPSVGDAFSPTLKGLKLLQPLQGFCAWHINPGEDAKSASSPGLCSWAPLCCTLKRKLSVSVQMRVRTLACCRL
jgi:hypothetical protein